MVNPSAAQQFTFTKIADSATAFPNGSGTFGSFDRTAIESGQVAFFGSQGGCNGKCGIYRGDGLTVSVVADWSMPMPGAPLMTNGATRFFRDFGAPSMDGGRISFVGKHRGNFSNPSWAGAYTFTGTSLLRNADTGTIIPGTLETFQSNDFAGSGIVGARVAFEAAEGPFVFNPIHRGLYLADDFSSVVTIANLSTNVPGGSGQFVAFSPLQGRDGFLVFRGEGSAGEVGLYLYDGTSISVLVDNTTTVADLGSAQIVGIQMSYSFDGETVAFIATVAGFGNPCLLTVGLSDGIVRNVSGLSCDGASLPGVPGRPRFASVPAIDGDEIALLIFGPPTAGYQGIWMRRGTEDVKVIDVTDMLDGKAVSSLGGLTAHSIHTRELAFAVRNLPTTLRHPGSRFSEHLLVVPPLWAG